LIETYFAAPHVLDRMRSGPMASYLGELAAELQSQGYSRKSIRRQLRNADAFGRWLIEADVPLAEVTDAILNPSVGKLHRTPCAARPKGWRPHNARGLPRLLALLRARGIIAPQAQPAPLAPDSTDGVLAAFDRHLEHDRGVVKAVRTNYLGHARSFLKAVFGDAAPDWTKIGPQHVAEFVLKRAEGLALTCRKDPGRSLAAFLRYLVGQGLVQAGLNYAIPRVRQWKHAALPRFLSVEDLNRVLATDCDKTPQGLRDKAMLLLLARLGLRAGEVLRLSLEDIDWRNGSLLVRAGKTRRERVLPLLPEVGSALVAYLKEGRPSSSHRTMFLNHCAPHSPLTATKTVTELAERALRSAGIDAHRPGAYVFRHTVATHMVRSGASFKGVADVLGHRTLAVTGVYAKLDLTALAQVALPWPGGAQ
jgi:site-specific recombinase XerD